MLFISAEMYPFQAQLFSFVLKNAELRDFFLPHLPRTHLAPSYLPVTDPVTYQPKPRTSYLPGNENLTI